MSKGYLLGVDIGTYESKGVLTTVDGNPVSIQVRPHGLSIPRQGWAEHDAEAVWWGDFRSIVQGLLEDAGIKANDILAVACSTIGPAIVPVDKEIRPLRPAILYGIDTRATDEIAFLEKHLGIEAIYEKCGTRLSAQSVGPKILWIKNNEPEIYNKAYKFVGGTTFLVARLTGKYVIDHYSCASNDPMYDPKTGEWNEEFCREIVDPRRLPEIGWTSEIAGTVTREVAQETGLAEGTPVTVGTIDAAAEAVSVGVVRPGQMMLMYGSTLFIIGVVKDRTTDKRLWSAPYLFPGTHAIMAGMATTGALTRWFRDNFAEDLKMKEHETGVNAYAELAGDAATVPVGSEGLIVLPYFSGERTPINDPKARGLIFGLTLAHSRGSVYRAILEAVGYGIKHHFDVFDNIGVDMDSIRAVGGGTKNLLWLQIVSDICGRAQEVPEVTFGASYGDAFLAGMGAGVFSSYDDISGWVKDISLVRPNPEATRRYEPYYNMNLELYRRNKDLMHSISKSLG
jgi:xylulokinase